MRVVTLEICSVHSNTEDESNWEEEKSTKKQVDLEELKLEGEIRGLLYSDSKEEKGKE